MNVALLEVLRARRGEWQRAEDLADHLFMAIPRLAQEVVALREAGYLVEAHPRRGYRFAGGTDRLIAHEIAYGLGTRTIGRNVVCLESTPSTNDEAWRLAERGAPEGTTVLAEEQTRGRGRFGRRWQCPKGAGILMSILLRPDAAPDASDARRPGVTTGSALTVMASVAVAQAISEDLRLPALIRWPNDIVARGRKVGGILLESRPQPGGGQAYVMGIGLNANVPAASFPPELRERATSLSELTGGPIERIVLVRAILRSLERWYREVQDRRYGLIAQTWRRFSSTLGARITVEEDGRRFTGRVLDISLDEGIVLGLDRGGTRIFDGARVTVVSPK